LNDEKLVELWFGASVLVAGSIEGLQYAGFIHATLSTIVV